FWRKRLARFLLVGGLALLATQVLPELPREQRVVLQAPRGARIAEAGLTYFREGELEAISGVQLHFSQPLAQVPHSLDLPNGPYRLELSVHGVDAEGQPVHWMRSEALRLDSGSAFIQLQ